MKASMIISTVALIASAAATPMVAARQAAGVPAQYFTFSLTNDQSGANAATSVAINAAPIALGKAFPWATNLWKNGKLVATSAQNINPGVQNVLCIFKDPSGRVIRINDKATFADLDGQIERAVETDVTNFTIECQQ